MIRGGLALLLMLAAAPAHATSVMYRTLRELTHDSQVVVQGQVTELESFWQGTRIYTRSRVALEDVWLGATPPTPYVDVITLGGVVGTIGQRVDGVAALPLHQRVVLQLRARDAGEYVPVALAQGVWLVDPAASTGGVTHVSRPSADRVVLRPGQVPDIMPNTLADLKRAILEAAREP